MSDDERERLGRPSSGKGGYGAPPPPPIPGGYGQPPRPMQGGYGAPSPHLSSQGYPLQHFPSPAYPSRRMNKLWFIAPVMTATLLSLGIVLHIKGVLRDVPIWLLLVVIFPSAATGFVRIWQNKQQQRKRETDPDELYRHGRISEALRRYFESERYHDFIQATEAAMLGYTWYAARIGDNMTWERNRHSRWGTSESWYVGSRHEVAHNEWSRRKARLRLVSRACPHSPMRRWQRRGMKRGGKAQGRNKP